ncbi:hypothetical protein ES705_11323 [subsurface metagenome]
MEPLNLPTYSFKIKCLDEKDYIFDIIRRDYFLLTPEEWVRQNFIQYLIHEKNYPGSLIRVEMFFKVNRLSKRGDIVLYDRKGKPLVLVECKSVKVNIAQKTFDQIARYNMKFRVNYLIVTNGLKHYCCKMDYSNHSYTFMKEIPGYDEIVE